MNVRADRRWTKTGYTISRVFVNGERFGDGKRFCNILEDEDRGLNKDMDLKTIKALKVPGQTAIPRGTYEVVITYSPKFKKNLPLVKDVPGWSGVRIHSANDASQLEGCLAPGINDIVGKVSNSRYWTNLLNTKIEQAIKSGERVWLTVG